MTLVKENTLYVDYGKVSEMMKLLNQEPTSVDEYVKWVRDWREAHAHIVGSIKFLRDAKNGIKYGTLESPANSKEEGINRAQTSKLNLRPYARRFYELRAERKMKFKEGAYGDPTFNRERGIEGVALTA